MKTIKEWKKAVKDEDTKKLFSTEFQQDFFISIIYARHFPHQP
jgi:hypothetical protein